MRSLQKWIYLLSDVLMSFALLIRLYQHIYIGMHVHICWTTLPVLHWDLWSMCANSRINLCSKKCYCDYRKGWGKDHREYCNNYKIWNKVTIHDYDYRMLVCTERKFLYLWPWRHNSRQTPTGNLLGSYTPHCSYFQIWKGELMTHFSRIIISASSFC